MIKSIIFLSAIMLKAVIATSDSCGKTVYTLDTNAQITWYGSGTSTGYLPGEIDCITSLSASCGSKSGYGSFNEGSCWCGYALGSYVSTDVVRQFSTSLNVLADAVDNAKKSATTVTLESSIGTHFGYGLVVSCSNNGKDEAWVKSAVSGWGSSKTVGGGSSFVDADYGEWYYEA